MYYIHMKMFLQDAPINKFPFISSTEPHCFSPPSQMPPLPSPLTHMLENCVHKASGIGSL